MKVICVPTTMISRYEGDYKFALFTEPQSPEIGRAGGSLPLFVRRLGGRPSSRAWDFLGISLAVIAADKAVLRSESPDGWTRQIHLVVSVAEVRFWKRISSEVEHMLQFLTGDLWTVEFVSGGSRPEKPHRPQIWQADCVSLLSGGLDSLVGGIDLCSLGKKPIFVSQTVTNDKDKQVSFASALKCAQIQFSQTVGVGEKNGFRCDVEPSTRARSLSFFAFAAMTATLLKRKNNDKGVELVVPENGFISLNVPFTPLRIGSLNTRTTHPVFIQRLQRVLDLAEINVSIVNPYQFRTKGEMLSECKNQQLLRKLAFKSASCGKGGRWRMHCGRCVPCLVRRGAFAQWGKKDKTEYLYANLSRRDADHKFYDDVASAIFAIKAVEKHGLKRWAGNAINAAQLGDTFEYYEVVERGLLEIEQFLKQLSAL